MLSLGVDLSVRPVRAVIVNERGEVIGRGSGANGAAAARAASAKQRVDRAGVVASDAAAKLSISGVSRLVRSLPGNAAIAAETWIGAAKKCRHAVCLHVDDEIHAGVMLNGKAWTGAHQRAGAAGWLALNPVDRQDYRRLGSLAAEISTGGIARRLSWRIQAGDESQVLEAAGGSLEAITGAMVFDAARNGDGVAISVVRDTAKYIGMAVATFAAAIDPEIVVVSGNAAAADLMLEPVRQECSRRLPAEWMNDLRVEFSPLGADALAIGAARLAMAA